MWKRHLRFLSLFAFGVSALALLLNARADDGFSFAPFAYIKAPRPKGPIEDRLAPLNVALEQARARKDSAEEIKTLYAIGGVYAEFDQPQKQLEVMEQVLAIVRRNGDKGGEAGALSLAAAVCNRLGRASAEIAAYQQALALYQQLGDKPNAERVRGYLGYAYTRAGQPQKQWELIQQALAAARQEGDRKAEADALKSLGYIYYLDPRQRDRSLPYFMQAQAIQSQLGDKRDEAVTLDTLATLYAYLGQSSQEQACYARELALYQALGDKMYEVSTLIRIGHLNQESGLPQKAIEHYQQALEIGRANGDRYGEADALGSISAFYDQVGRPEQALSYYAQFLEAEKAATAQRDAGRDYGPDERHLNNQAHYYERLGQYRQALDCYLQEQAAWDQLTSASGNAGGPVNRTGLGRAVALDNIGRMYWRLGQRQKSQEAYAREIQLRQQLFDQEGDAANLGYIGLLYAGLGLPQKALAYYQQALPRFQSAGNVSNEASTLNNIGLVYARLGQPEQAFSYLAQAAEKRHQSNAKAPEINTLYSMALIEARQHRTADAERHLQAAFLLLETLRENLGGFSAAKSSFLASHLDIYDRYLALLLQEGKTAEAFALAQKTKARVLLDLMIEGKVQMGASLPPEERQKAQELRRSADQLNLAIVRESIRNEVGARQRVAVLKEQLRQAESTLQSYTDSLYARHPEGAHTQAARTLTLADMAHFLPADTALLEYITLRAGGERRQEQIDDTVLLVVTIEKGVPVVHAYGLSLRSAALVRQVNALRQACVDPRRDYRESGAALYRRLIAPAARQIAGKRRLLICPDGPLWDVPFAALLVAADTPPSPSSPPSPLLLPGLLASRAPEAPFLWQSYEIVYAYSATSAQAALEARQSRSQSRPAGSLLVFANPDFAAETRFGDEPRVPGQRPIPAESRPIPAEARPIPAESRTLFLPRGARLPRLPGTQAEAEALKQDFPDAVLYTGDQAQEATAKREAGKYRYLHFATHGFFNDAAPLLSSIVLARPEPGSEEDGFLTAREIFDLNLNAEMVVLSACNTARGEKRRGEGIVGLTWALFAAGAPTQVVSQWGVDDASTATLMRAFYGNLTQQGQGKGAALRSAALALMQDGKHAHPYYWAPFLLIGDWN